MTKSLEKTPDTTSVTRTVSVRLDRATYTALLQHASREKLRPSDVLRIALLRHLKQPTPWAHFEASRDAALLHEKLVDLMETVAADRIASKEENDRFRAEAFEVTTYIKRGLGLGGGS